MIERTESTRPFFEIMTSRARKPSIFAFAALCALGTALAAAATQVVAPENPGNRQELNVDTATLERYVGNYQIGSKAILTVTREATQLNAQITGQPKLPIYAEAPNKFFWKVVDAQVTFDVADSGAATSATIHQNGRDVVAPRLDEASAQAFEQQLTDRISRRQPQSGSEAALRKSIAAIGAGTPNYADMTEPLQGAMRQQLPALEGYFTGDYGTVQSVEFRGVTDAGVDKYLVTYQSGKQLQFFINLDDDGKISGLLLREAF